MRSRKRRHYENDSSDEVDDEPPPMEKLPRVPNGNPGQAQNASENSDQDGDEVEEGEIKNLSTDTLILDATLNVAFSDDDDAPSQEDKTDKTRPAIYDEALPSVTGTRQASLSRLPLSQRLNLRSNPVLPPSRSPERFTVRPNVASEPFSDRPLVLERPTNIGSRLSARLNTRSRPPLPSTPPPRASENLCRTPEQKTPEDPNRTPEPPRTPDMMKGSSSNENSLNVSFAASEAFSSCNDEEFSMNVSVCSQAESRDEEGEEEEEEEENEVEEEAVVLSESGAVLADRLLGEQVCDEPMDWHDLHEDLANCRKQAQRRVANLVDFEGLLSPGAQVFKKIVVVVDTNIFISQLSQVKQLLNDRFYAKHIILYLPWAVMCELDVLKTRTDEILKKNARNAINFLLELLRAKNPNIQGQTGLEDKDASLLYKANGADDRILQTCLKLKSQGMLTVLYTNDKNLALKSQISAIDAYSSLGLLKGLQERISQMEEEDNSNGENMSLASISQVDPNFSKSASQDEVAEVKAYFEEVWKYIWKYTRRYCLDMDIPFFPTYEMTGLEDGFLPPRLNLEGCANHLCQITMRTVELAEYLYCFLKIDRVDQLTVISPVVGNLFKSLTSFFVNLEVPLEDPATPELPTIRQMALLAFLQHQNIKTEIANGFGKIQGLRSLLISCQNKIRIVNAPIKRKLVNQND